MKYLQDNTLKLIICLNQTDIYDLMFDEQTLIKLDFIDI
jgi:hypothetical protein